MAQLHCAAPHCPEKTFRIHLPTYNTIADDFSVGVDSAFDTFVPDESHFQNPRNASIVWYGSSILQGAVASRPGQIMTHEVSRNLGTLILYVSKLAVWRNIAVDTLFMVFVWHISSFLALLFKRPHTKLFPPLLEILDLAGTALWSKVWLHTWYKSTLRLLSSSLTAIQI